MHSKAMDSGNEITKTFDKYTNVDEPTQVKTAVPTPPLQHYSPIKLANLLLVFPPLALYKMYQDTRYHRWFSYTLWIIAGWQAIFYAIRYVFIAPRAEILYDFYILPSTPPSNLTLSLSVATLVVIEVIVGIILYKKASGTLATYKNVLHFSIFVLLVGYLFGALMAVYLYIIPFFTLNQEFNLLQ